jgi:hypothetical protein
LHFVSSTHNPVFGVTTVPVFCPATNNSNGVASPAIGVLVVRHSHTTLSRTDAVARQADLIQLEQIAGGYDIGARMRRMWR